MKTIETNKFIKLDFDLINHSKELSKTDSNLDKLKEMIESVERTRVMPIPYYDKLYKDVMKELHYLGNLSLKTLNLDVTLEKMYSNPNISVDKHMWLEHYEDLNKPYSVLKNKAYRLLDSLNDVYLLIFGTKSPNAFDVEFSMENEKILEENTED